MIFLSVDGEGSKRREQINAYGEQQEVERQPGRWKRKNESGQTNRRWTTI